jgi:hypothetical protein
VGLISGAITDLISPFAGDAFLLAGFFFGVALWIGLSIALRRKLITARPPLLKLLIGIIWLSLTYVMIGVIGFRLEDKLLRWLGNQLLCDYVTISLMGIASAVAVSICLWLLVGKIDARATLLMLLIGVVAGQIVLLASQRTWAFPVMPFQVILQTMAGIGCGYWFARTIPRHSVPA